MDNLTRYYPEIPTYGNISKICPQKLRFTGNFTRQYRMFDIMPERDDMRRDILDSVLKRTESIMMEHLDSDGVNPLYEDPKDVIGNKPSKPPRKRNVQGLAVASPRSSKEGRSLLKEQKRKLTKKYEGLITALMDKCEEHAVLMSEKDSHITKLKEKLKTVLDYNKLFADENDRLRAEHSTLVNYTNDCKKALKEQQEIGAEMEKRCKRLEEKIKQYELPDREQSEPSTAIPLVEVCMSCSSRQILLQQARDQNYRLQKDMQGLKDVLYRLNVQLSRYQEKIRSSAPVLTSDGNGEQRAREKYDGFDSLIAASLGQRQDGAPGEERRPHGSAAAVADLSGLLSAQALAPLFDAYQENLQEKDNLILDYEKQFEIMNNKSKQIVTENNFLKERAETLEDELARVRQTYKKLAMEKETMNIERITLAERAEKAETKLKEVYELYEDKMSAMRRDYETVHREYYATKSALDACSGHVAQLDAMRARTVPADLHERRLDHCKRLLEELKHQYGMESERRSGQLQKAQQQLKAAEESCAELRQERDRLAEQLAAALKNVKLYRKAAAVFRQRALAAAARASRRARGWRRGAAGAGSEPLRRALDALQKIKLEIKAVKSRAHSSLQELERRIVQQERRAAHAQAEARRELERAALALAHKEGIIRSLIDKVADVEEVRLSQTNTHRLQGIVSDLSPGRSDSPDNREKRDSKPAATPMPDRDARRKTKS